MCSCGCVAIGGLCCSEIAEMQCEDPPHQQQAGATNQNIYLLHRPAIAQVYFEGLNYLDDQSPLSPQLKASLWPQNYRAGTYPKTMATHIVVEPPRLF
jgi:hypothetical protein